MLQFQEIRVVEIIIVLYSSYVKKQEEKYDPNSREKKKLMSELFGGLTIDSTWNTSSSNNNNNNLFESKNVVIEKNQFTTINDEFELVTSLSFLNTFVQSRVNGKTYDENISDRLWEIQFWFSSIEYRTI